MNSFVTSLNNELLGASQYRTQDNFALWWDLA